MDVHQSRSRTIWLIEMSGSNPLVPFMSVERMDNWMDNSTPPAGCLSQQATRGRLPWFSIKALEDVGGRSDLSASAEKPVVAGDCVVSVRPTPARPKCRDEVVVISTLGASGPADEIAVGPARLATLRGAHEWPPLLRYI